MKAMMVRMMHPAWCFNLLLWGISLMAGPSFYRNHIARSSFAGYPPGPQRAQEASGIDIDFPWSVSASDGGLWPQLEGCDLFLPPDVRIDPLTGRLLDPELPEDNEVLWPFPDHFEWESTRFPLQLSGFIESDPGSPGRDQLLFRLGREVIRIAALPPVAVGDYTLVEVRFEDECMANGGRSRTALAMVQDADGQLHPIRNARTYHAGPRQLSFTLDGESFRIQTNETICSARGFQCSWAQDPLDPEAAVFILIHPDGHPSREFPCHPSPPPP
jgi:hypothetical protein